MTRTLKISGLIILLLVVLGAPASQSPRYELIRLENESYRDYSRDELSTLIGEDQALLPNFLCDGVREFQVLPELIVKNPKKDSLRIQGDDPGEVIFYRESKFYALSGEEIPKLKRSFYRQVKRALEKLESIPSGQILLRRIEAAPYPVVIKITQNWMMFNPMVDGRNGSGKAMATAILIFKTGRKSSSDYWPFKQIGSGGTLFWGPDIVIQRYEVDGQKREVPSYMSLGHEMYHSFDSVRGLLDERSVWNLQEYEQAEVSEYRAVYFENQLRKELGMKLIKRYGQVDEGADMLDANGNPILIPGSLP